MRVSFQSALIFALRADLAHVPYWAPPLRSGVPFVVTVHDIIPRVLREYRGGPASAECGAQTGHPAGVG